MNRNFGISTYPLPVGDAISTIPVDTGVELMVFSYPGTLTASLETPPWYPTRSGVITTVRVSLLANAGADHVVELRKDGSAIQQFTLTSGTKTIETATTIAVARGSYISMKTITVSNADLSVELTLT